MKYPSATELRDRLATGTLSATEVVECFLREIELKEPEVQAWAWLDPDHVRQQARACDERREAGLPLGSLHGLPVGLKDIIDTAGIPTENGTALDAGRIPDTDATIVSLLKQAGAIIMGKTVTSELANRGPGKTRNPYSPAHTPGGSSSGSAAAVAAGMVPLAVGTQTAGSVIRPAAFCGVVGYKPSFGAIPRAGILQQSSTLDTVGVLAKCVADAALLAEALIAGSDNDTSPAPSALPNPDRATLDGVPSKAPALAFVRQPAWTDAEPATRQAFDHLAGQLEPMCRTVELPELFADALNLHRIVHYAEMAYAYRDYEARGRTDLFPATVTALDAGKKVLAGDYLAALEMRTELNAGLEEIFERYDAILTPAAPGPAPADHGTTGNPAFNAIWTYCGTPAITLPLLTAPDGLPVGVQLVGRVGDDARLLRTADWLSNLLSQS